MTNWRRTPVSRRALMAGVGLTAAFALARPRVPQAATVNAKRIRLGDHGDSTRFVMDVSGPVRWQTFALDNPTRLVLDVENIALADDGRPPRTGVISAVRTGQSGPNTTRIVLDLTKPALPDKDFLLEPREGHPWRLVLDIVPVTQAAFTARLGVVPPPVTPNTLTPEPSTRLAETSPGVLASGNYPYPPPMKPGGSSSGVTASGVVALTPVYGSYRDPIHVRLANGRRVPVPLPKPGLIPPVIQKPLIVLDAGHGGRDPGAIGASGIHEKVITLAMARDLRAALQSTGRYRVLLTRDSDKGIQLRERIEIGRRAGGDLFISIHADALKDKSVRGFSVYTLSENASDAEAAALADRENKADILIGADLSNQSPDVATILIDLAQRATHNNSALFANTVIRTLPADIPRLGKPHRSAGFAVLKAPDMPSVLLEIGFLSNATDERLLRDSAHRTKLARAVVKSIDTYMDVQQQHAWSP